MLTDKQMLDSTLRHSLGRKLDNFADAPLFNRTGEVTMEEWNSLPHTHDACDSPFDGCSLRDAFLFFYHRPNDGKVYLVNTEGFSYHRYIAEVNLPVKPPVDVLVN